MSPLRLIRVPLVSRSPGESHKTRAFHSTYLPPVLALPSDDVSDDGSGSLSPRQTQGPLTLTPEDIRARINGNRSVAPSSLEKPRDESQMDEVMPTLSSKFFFVFPLLSFLIPPFSSY